MKDEWLRAALTDDAVVVELLFRLKGASSEASTTPSMPSLPIPPVSWGLRLPRSKTANTFRKESTTTTTTTTTATNRCSPTTPLSWSGGAAASLSDSGYADSSASRSKGTFASEVTNISSTNKRSKRKKTFSELKEEEDVLIKERVHLKKELASVHVTLNEQRVWSDNLKRIKFDLNLQSSETGATAWEAETLVPIQWNGMEESISYHDTILPRDDTGDEHTFASSYRVREDIETQRKCFVLPDLNMLPTEEEITAEIL